MATKKKSVKKTTSKKTSSKKKTAKKSFGDTIVGYKTVDLNMCSFHDSTFKFVIGKNHVPKDLKKSHWDGAICGVGLHFAPTKEGALSYANDPDECILLEVEANLSDVMSKSPDDKFRVSKLKVNRVIQVFDKWPDQRPVIQEMHELEANFPSSCSASKKTIQKHADEWTRLHGRKSKDVKIITDPNLLEMLINDYNHIYNTLNYNRVYEGDEEFTFYGNISEDNTGCVQDLIEDMINEYVGYHSNIKKNKTSINKMKPLIELIKIGAFPFGETKTKELIVFAPDEKSSDDSVTIDFFTSKGK